MGGGEGGGVRRVQGWGGGGVIVIPQSISLFRAVLIASLIPF